jgi:uncharacterized protein (DUF849 family)
VTGHQLRDIFDSTKKVAEIKRKIYDTILFNKRFPKTLAVNFLNTAEDKKDVEEETKAKALRFDLVKFFNDVGAPECINKLQKQDLLDAQLFFKMDFGALEGILELKPEGKKIRVTQKL